MTKWHRFIWIVLSLNMALDLTEAARAGGGGFLGLWLPGWVYWLAAVGWIVNAFADPVHGDGCRGL